MTDSVGRNHGNDHTGKRRKRGRDSCSPDSGLSAPAPATGERWRDVVGYGGWYQVSDTGRVRSLDRVVTRRDGLVRFVQASCLRLSPTAANRIAVTCASA